MSIDKDNERLDKFEKQLSGFDLRLSVQNMRFTEVNLKLDALKSKLKLNDEDDDEDEDITRGLSIGQAIDLLREGKAEKVTCYTTDQTYMYFCEDKEELRTKALNGIDFPWVIKERELQAIFRVIE